ncbi:hypothetical protein BKA70DRAFT_1248524 [Coprinopsis sp. MPI-PUGE-AT-0042]|nr:hypothetical protein BKA70DRAFT_1248524 [Coprinopsis sp. MPI-PUGE-AT-0042]
MGRGRAERIRSSDDQPLVRAPCPLETTAMSDELDSTPTNVARPKTSATITVRIIKSFKFRTEKSLVLHNTDLTTITVGQLKEIARQAIQTQAGWKPYRNAQLDTLKLYTKAHGAKAS